MKNDDHSSQFNILLATLNAGRGATYVGSRISTYYVELLRSMYWLRVSVHRSGPVRGGTFGPWTGPNKKKSRSATLITTWHVANFNEESNNTYQRIN